MNTLPPLLEEHARAVLAACATAKAVVATAESCTGGLIAAALTAISGSSAYMDRGFVTYSNTAKTEMLGVPADLILRVGAVSEEVARAMAEGALARSPATATIAVTGVAGPTGGSPEKPVGLVHFAAARRGGSTSHERHIFPGDRDAVRLATALTALELLVRRIFRGQLKETLPMRLAGKFALITGGSDGIGYGIAEAFAQQGASLCLVARDAKKLDAAGTKLEALGGKTTVIAADLGKPDAVDSVAKAVKALDRPLDILVNNAGTATFVPYLEASREQYNTGVNLNVTVPYFLSQALIPSMPSGGSIINISSYFAGKMLPGRPSSIYSLTKGAMNSLTKAMAYELAPRGIRVNAIAPGTIDTPLRRQSIAVLPQEQQNAMSELVKRIYPLGRIGKISDMGGIAVFLASAESEWATGAIFAIDGGLTIT